MQEQHVAVLLPQAGEDTREDRVDVGVWGVGGDGVDAAAGERAQLPGLAARFSPDEIGGDAEEPGADVGVAVVVGEASAVGDGEGLVDDVDRSVRAESPSGVSTQ